MNNNFGEIIGFVGTKGSGKGEAAEILKGRGYEYFSLSDTIRKYKDPLETSQDVFSLQDKANRLRAEKGNSILAKLVIEEIGELRGREIVIDGIRHPEEIAALKEVFLGMIIVSTDADPEIRFKRIKERGRKGDPETWEEFQRMERRESWGEENNSGQQVARCMELADYHISNNTDVKAILESEINRMLAVLQERVAKSPERK